MSLSGRTCVGGEDWKSSFEMLLSLEIVAIPLAWPRSQNPPLAQEVKKESRLQLVSSRGPAVPAPQKSQKLVSNR